MNIFSLVRDLRFFNNEYKAMNSKYQSLFSDQNLPNTISYKSKVSPLPNTNKK